jgi:hypothetical protein
MEIAIVAGFSAKRDMKVNACHVDAFQIRNVDLCLCKSLSPFSFSSLHCFVFFKQQRLRIYTGWRSFVRIKL